MNALKLVPGNMYFVPVKFLTKAHCMRLFRKDNSVFQYIPDKFKNDEICQIALENNSSNIEFVPKKYLTKKIICKYIPIYNSFFAWNKVSISLARDIEVARILLNNYINYRNEAVKLITPEVFLKYLGFFAVAFNESKFGLGEFSSLISKLE